MKNILVIVFTFWSSYSAFAEGDWGQYRLYGRASDNTGKLLLNAEILFITGKDTAIVKTDSLGNFETKITWRTFDRTFMGSGIDIKTENVKMNPPIMAIWNNKSVSIVNRWEEAQNAQYKSNWIDKPIDLTF